MKRFWSFSLAFAMLVSCAVFPIDAAKYYDEGAFKYEKISSGTAAKIVEYNGLDDALVIPETLGGLPVVAIADGAVECTNGVQIESVFLPKYLADFSADVFYGNHSLKTIELDEENTAFVLKDGVLYNENMGKLILYPAMLDAKEFVIPEGVQVIGAAAFYHAQNLERVYFPDTLKTISPAQTNLFGAFENCTGLTKLDIPTSVRTIGDYAFMGCTSLETVNIPRSSHKDRTIGLGAFLNCPNLLSVHLFDCIKSVEAESFGYISALNGGDAMTTSRVEGFTIYGIRENEGGGKYAVENGFDFVKMSVKSDFFFSDASVIGPEADLSCISGVSASYSSVPSGLRDMFFDLSAAYLTFEFIAASGKEIPSVFSEEVFYSVPAPSELSDELPVYVFAVETDEYTGRLTLNLVQSYLTTSVDTWGDPAQRLLFSAKENRSFLFVCGEPTPGLVVRSDEPSTEPSLGDLTEMAKFLGGMDAAVNYLNCDLTGEGQVEVGDLTVLAKVLSGWDEPMYAFASKF
ncbi:MAG: leucine-rich repeat domain-containing protein [Clostridia bacterium]|nr:leucine-rich repeat domain-containing protein [Clostridia bacterium]